jgi:phage FluMu protein Com
MGYKDFSFTIHCPHCDYDTNSRPTAHIGEIQCPKCHNIFQWKQHEKKELYRSYIAELYLSKEAYIFDWNNLKGTSISVINQSNKCIMEININKQLIEPNIIITTNADYTASELGKLLIDLIEKQTIKL